MENEDGGLYDHDIDDKDIDGSEPDKQDSSSDSGAKLGSSVSKLYGMNAE
jgi:hypothetical protein